MFSMRELSLRDLMKYTVSNFGFQMGLNLVRIFYKILTQALIMPILRFVT